MHNGDVEGSWIIYWRNFVTFSSPRRQYVFSIMREMAQLSGLELVNEGDRGFVCYDKHGDVVFSCRYDANFHVKINGLSNKQSSISRARYYGKRHIGENKK